MADVSNDAAAILREAADIVSGSRRETHGEPERCFETIATFWDVYLCMRNPGMIEATDVAVMMALLKLARSLRGKPARDHFTDMAGYAALSGELALSGDAS